MERKCIKQLLIQVKNKLFFKVNKNSAIQWLMISGIFLPVNFMMILFPMVLELFSLILATLLFYTIRKKIFISGNLLLLMLLLSAFYIGVIFFNGYFYDKFIRETFFCFLFFVLYSVLFKYIRLDINSLFDRYLKLSYWISVFAIIQFVMYFVLGIDLFSFFSRQTSEIMPHCIRVTAFEVEPSVLSAILTPSFVYSIFNFKQCVKRTCVIFLAVFLTFSTVTFVISLSVFIYYFIRKTNLFIRFFVLFSFLFLMLSSDLILNDNTENNHSLFKEISTKIDQTYNGLKDLDPQEIEMLNLSSYASLMNLYVAIKAPSRIVGTGIGTHSQSYENVYQSDYENYGLNRHDAYSLGTRIYSEFGIVGIILISMFIIYNFNPYSIINISVLFILITFLLRGGHYFINGTIFFFFLYYYTSKKYVNR